MVDIMSIKIGYARVSTKDQNFNLQLDAQKQASCAKIFKDTISGAKTERPALDDMLTQLRPGDAVTFRLRPKCRCRNSQNRLNN
jgi:DNA invertase Pin-like site-specific DNA recombinase